MVSDGGKRHDSVDETPEEVQISTSTCYDTVQSFIGHVMVDYGCKERLAGAAAH